LKEKLNSRNFEIGISGDLNPSQQTLQSLIKPKLLQLIVVIGRIALNVKVLFIKETHHLKASEFLRHLQKLFSQKSR